MKLQSKENGRYDNVSDDAVRTHVSNLARLYDEMVIIPLMSHFQDKKLRIHAVKRRKSMQTTQNSTIYEFDNAYIRKTALSIQCKD